MLNAGVLALHVPSGPLSRAGLAPRRRFVLTKTLEWNLYWGVLDPMWDDDGVRLRPEWLADEAGLRRRLRLLALANAAVAPFLLLFLIIYFTMKVGGRVLGVGGEVGEARGGHWGDTEGRRGLGGKGRGRREWRQRGKGRAEEARPWGAAGQARGA